MATKDNKLEFFSQGSEEDYSLVCIACHGDGTKIPAHGYCTVCLEHMCQGCLRYHKKATLSRHHLLQDKATMPSTQQLTGTPIQAGPTDNLTTPCFRHKTEVIKLYCHDHELLLCSICVALEHTKPCHVDYIPEVSDKMPDSPDYKHMMHRIDKLLKKCTTIKTETSRDINKSNDSLKEALQEVKKHRQEINKRIDELEKEIETKIKALQHRHNEQNKNVETICEDVMKRIKTTYDNMKQLNKSKQTNQLYMEVKQAKKQLQEYEQSIKSLSTEDSIDEYKFIPNQGINDLLQKEKMIGDISITHQPQTDLSSLRNILPASTDDTITPTCLGEIYVKTSDDKIKCWITGMTVLCPDRLVLADCNNKSIKLVDVNSKSIISQLSLGTELVNRPWDITSTTSTQVAVTVPRRQHIQFISVSDKLSKSHTLQTDGVCVGICCHQDKLIVTYQEPGKLEILDMRGRIITRVTTDSTGTDIFTRPLYVEANSRSIYVTEVMGDIRGEEVEEVIMLNWNGEITGRIKGNKAPRGLALLHDGSLLVCVLGDDKVCQVAGDGTNRRTVLQNGRSPWSVCVDDGGHKLYISRWTKEDKPDNNILIYTI